MDVANDRGHTSFREVVPWAALSDMCVSTVCFLPTVPSSLRTWDKEVRMQDDTTGSKRTTPIEWASLILIVVLWISASATLAQSYYCDDLGNCTGSGISTYADDSGNTSGRIGGDRMNLYGDSLGNTSGRIGDRRINCYTDRLGKTSCR